FVFIFSCKKKSGKLPLIVTLSVSGIGESAANCGATVYAEGDFPITAKGLCWSTTNNSPDVDDQTTDEGGGPESFSSTMTGLSASTTYYVRAYATNKIGTSYGAIR